MRPQEAELLRKYTELAMSSHREAQESFMEEARHERDHAGLREDARAAYESAGRARKDAEEAEGRLRKELGEHEAAVERVTACEEHAARRAEDQGTAVEKLARVRRRLAGRITAESDLAERGVRRAGDRLGQANTLLAEARMRVAISEERLTPLQEEAENKREFANREAARAEEFDERIVADIEKLSDRRVESRSAMSRAWVYKKVSESYRQIP
jgi:hypothetical protein